MIGRQARHPSAHWENDHFAAIQSQISCQTAANLAARAGSSVVMSKLLFYDRAVVVKL